MRKKLPLLAWVWLWGCPGLVWATDLKILPAEITLTGPHASQRLEVLSEASSKYVGDVTPQAKFVSSNPKIASVDEAGVVRAAGDGEAVITATQGGRRVTARVKVQKVKAPFAWSFRNHV